MTIPDWMARMPTSDHWERLGGPEKRLGVVCPVFSLRTSRSQGIGDFDDLEAMVDWCVAIGASVLQLLPLNDIGADTSPYSALSAMALEPSYISLRSLAPLVGDPRWEARVDEAARELERDRGRVRYRRVRELKLGLLREALAIMGDVEGLEQFRADNPWFDGYAAFKIFREQAGYVSWETWAQGRPASEWIARARREFPERVRFHLFLQWLASRQLAEAKAYAASRGVLLKGDIPILVGRDSADVWEHPNLFRLDTVAGAPPDMYAEQGQNWGFPTYDWPAHEADGYSWWQARLARLESYFDMYRVDHVVGFFRIWTIPFGEKTGVNGWFEPWDERVWGDHGRKLLQMMLDATHLLPLAEDLGTIPPVCRQVLGDMGIPGLKVARWEKRWESDRSFIPPSDYPLLSVATSSTHDSETLAGWWQAFPGEREQLHREMGLPGEPGERLTRDQAEAILGALARAGSVFTILPAWDLLYLGEGYLPEDPAESRINVPAILDDRNWTFRFGFLMEELLGDHGLNERLAGLLAPRPRHQR